MSALSIQMNSDTFCVMPWVGLNITNQGFLTPCCAYQEPTRTPHFTVGEYDQWRSEYMLPLQQALLQGERPDCCNQCWKLEAQTHEYDVNLSERLIYNKILGTHWIEQKNPPVKFISVAFGTTCNLKCNHCGPYSSSSWSTEIKQNPKLLEFKPIWSDNPDWFEKPENISKLDEISGQLEHIRIIGGEPLFSPEALKYMSDLPAATKLDIITNATQLKPRALEILSKFQELRITVSIDGIQDHAEYVRYPSRWADVEKNILTLRSLPNVAYFGVNYVLQHYSRWTLIPTINWCLEHEISLRVQPLLYHQYLGINSMEPQHCQQLIQELDQFVQQNKQRIFDIEKRIPFSYLVDSIKKMLQEQYHYSPAGQQKFVEFHAVLDQVREQKFQDFFREK